MAMSAPDGGAGEAYDAALAASAEPGVATLEFLRGTDKSVLSPSDLVDAVITSERLLAHVNALQCGLLAELGRPGRAGDVSRLVQALVDKTGQGRGADGSVDGDLVAELTRDKAVGMAATQVAAVLDWSPTTARIRIDQATDLISTLPKTFAALNAGRIDVGRSRMIIDRTDVLDINAKAVVEQQILPLVKGRSKARLETQVDRAVIIADPEAAERRAGKAKKDRSVIHRPDRDGMGIINALLPAESAVQVITLVNLIADANAGLDDRTVAQRRADALADIADQLLTDGYVDLTGLTPTGWTNGNDGVDSDANSAADTTAQTHNESSTTDSGTVATHGESSKSAAAHAGPADSPGESTAHTTNTVHVAQAEPSMVTNNVGASAASTPAIIASGGAASVPSDSSGTTTVPGAAQAETPMATSTFNAPTDSATVTAAGLVAAEEPTEFSAVGTDAAKSAAVVRRSAPGSAERGSLSRVLTRHGRRPHLVVTGALSTLAGLDDLPGHLDGHGTITAGLFRMIAKSCGTLSTVGVDPATGTGVAVGALVYRPRQQVADQIIMLAGTCRMAGCRQPAWRCEIDHVEPFNHQDLSAGGSTSPTNLEVLCKWHHLLKHHTDWRPTLLPNQSIRWVSPTGHQSVDHPREFTLPGEWFQLPRCVVSSAPGDESAGSDHGQKDDEAVRHLDGASPFGDGGSPLDEVCLGSDPNSGHCHREDQAVRHLDGASPFGDGGSPLDEVRRESDPNSGNCQHVDKPVHYRDGASPFDDGGSPLDEVCLGSDPNSGSCQHVDKPEHYRAGESPFGDGGSPLDEVRLGSDPNSGHCHREDQAARHLDGASPFGDGGSPLDEVRRESDPDSSRGEQDDKAAHHRAGASPVGDVDVPPVEYRSGSEPGIDCVSSELEDPDTIPRTGTPAAWTYRVLRRDLHDQTMRRVRHAREIDPKAALKRAFFQGLPVDIADEDLDPATLAAAILALKLRSKRGGFRRHALNRTTTRRDRPRAPDSAERLDEPPF